MENFVAGDRFFLLLTLGSVSNRVFQGVCNSDRISSLRYAERMVNVKG